MELLYEKSDFSLNSFHSQKSRSGTARMLELEKRKENLSLLGCLWYTLLLQAARNGGGSLSIDLKRRQNQSLRLSEKKMGTNE